MSDDPGVELRATVLGAPEPRTLMRFWRDLLGWQVRMEREDWAMLVDPGGGAGLSFQVEEAHAVPTWSADDDQQGRARLDVAVDDLPGGVTRAVALGATVAEHQPQDDVRLLLDPVGHPFCLFVPHH